MNRRDFFKSASLTLAGLMTLPMLAKAQERRRGGAAPAAGKEAGGMPPVDPKSAEAKALAYHENAAEVKDAKLKIERSGTPWGQQHCKNCVLFLGKAGDKRAGCGVFPGKSVNAEGFCTSWVLKK